MPDFLFLSQPAYGHVYSLLGIANRLSEAGHGVRFLVPGLARPITTGIKILDSGQEVSALIARSGLPVHPLAPHPSLLWNAFLLPRKSGPAETAHAFRMFFGGIAHYARGLLGEIGKRRPDVLVADYAFPAAALAAEIAGLPFAAVYHSGLPFRGPGIPPFGSGLPIGLDASGIPPRAIRDGALLEGDVDRCMGKARRAFGLPPLPPGLLRRPYSPWLNLVASAGILEAPRDNLTPNTFFAGPCTARRREGPFPFGTLRPEAYKVYVSLGTVFNDKPGVFRKIMRALDDPGYQVIVSAGGAYDALAKGPLPASAAVYRQVPQLALLERVDLFISHGGNNSVNEALAAGKPILVLPVGGEQADNASRIVWLGAGTRADIDGFTEAQLRAQVEAMRRMPAYREKAEALRDGLRRLDGTRTAARALAWLAERKRPLVRPDGFPLTPTAGEMEGWLAEA